MRLIMLAGAFAIATAQAAVAKRRRPSRRMAASPYRAPDIIVGSWCGKKFRPEKVACRPGFDRVPAVRGGAVHEIKSPLILQPGPAALTDGLAALQAIIGRSSG